MKKRHLFKMSEASELERYCLSLMKEAQGHARIELNLNAQEWKDEAGWVTHKNRVLPIPRDSFFSKLMGMWTASLVYLGLGANNISNEDCQALVRCICLNSTTLEALDLYGDWTSILLLMISSFKES